MPGDDELSSVEQAVSSTTIYTSGFTAGLFQSGAYDKPIVIIEGFDPLDELWPDRYWTSYLASSCHPAVFDLPGATPICPGVMPGSLPAVAAAQGWDVWVVSVNATQATKEVWNTAAAYNVQLHDLILRWTGTPRKYILAGYSAGGVIARKALSLLGTRRATDVRAYVSVDAPHEGAYIPYAYQQYLLDHGICDGSAVFPGDPYGCHNRFITNALATPVAASLIKARIVPTNCNPPRPGWTWPSFFSDCADVGGCTLPDDGDWSACDSRNFGGDGDDFTTIVRSPSWFSTQYGGWFTDIPRYAISNSSFTSNYLPPHDLYTERLELLHVEVNTINDHHLYADMNLQPEVRGSLDPFSDQFDGVKVVNNNAPDAVLHKINSWNFISFDSAFGVNQGLSWTGKLIGQNRPPGDSLHTYWTADTVQYLKSVVSATFSSTTYAGLRGPASACGDGVCAGPDNGETWQYCPADCQPYCGDGACNGTESCSSCSRDCGTCPVENCCPPGSTCLAGGTAITMDDGSHRKIEDVRVGDRVLSYDTTLGRITKSVVTKTFAHTAEEGTLLINGKLRATPNHPFFVGGTWKRADELEMGDDLLVFDPRASRGLKLLAVTPDTVRSLVSVPGTLETFNLEVAGEHDYFADGVLVHNKTCVVCDPL